MCMICDGATEDEFLFDLYGKIDRFGWAVISVEASHDTPNWSYTVGLSDGWDHPELVVVGLQPYDAQRLLNLIGGRIRQGERFDPGMRLAVPQAGVDVHFGAVHPEQWEHGVFGTWEGYYDAVGPPYPDEQAIQVILPTGRRGRRPHVGQRLLHQPDDVLHLPRPNRAQRRAQLHLVPKRS